MKSYCIEDDNEVMEVAEEEHKIQHSRVSEDTEDDDDVSSYESGSNNDGTKNNSFENTNDDDEDDEYSDEDDETTWGDDLMSSWRQHTVAFIVALIATYTAYYYQQQNKANSQRHDGLIMMTPTTWIQSEKQGQRNLLEQQQKHAHLDNYKRTSNVTFCDMEKSAVSDRTLLEKNLFIMDFDLPIDFIPTMALHFAADLEEDDTYSDVMGRPTTSLSSSLLTSHDQYHCLQSLKDSASKKYVKGLTFYYKNPSIESMYPDHNENNNLQLSVMKQDTKLQPALLSFTGFAAKFVNLSPKPVLLYWDGRNGEARSLVGELAPFEALSTATTPGQSFSVSPVYDHTIEMERWILTADDAVMYYEPTDNKLNPTERQLYQMQILNREFAKHYQIHAKRTWLAHFPRAFPVHPMWPARYFGQKHTIETGNSSYTLSVASVTPRVFTIANFLSADECDKLIELAKLQGMKGSTVYAGGRTAQQKQRNLNTRSSSNAWLARDTAEITDHIYRRAAHALQIDESLLQAPMIDDELHAHHHSIAESLQVIRYKKKEEYTAHHDWVIPSQRHRYQPTRFATLLIYLNDDFEGGHTVFPRAVNTQYHDGIRIVPKKGNAILFYNMLPDGNVDDLSQHSSEPIIKGEKYAANVWIWEPMIN